MAVDRIQILNAPDNSVDTADKYQLAVGMYPGTDESGTGFENGWGRGGRFGRFRTGRTGWILNYFTLRWRRFR